MRILEASASGTVLQRVWSADHRWTEGWDTATRSFFDLVSRQTRVRSPASGGSDRGASQSESQALGAPEVSPATSAG